MEDVNLIRFKELFNLKLFRESKTSLGSQIYVTNIQRFFLCPVHCYFWGTGILEEISFESEIADPSEKSFFLELFKASRLCFLLADLDRELDLADLISESVTLSLNLLKRWFWTGSLRSTCSLKALNTSISPLGADSVFIEVIVSSVIVGSKADEASVRAVKLVNTRLSV